MRRPSKWISTGLMVCLLGGSLGGTIPIDFEPPQARREVAVPPAVWTAVDQARQQAKEYLELDLVVPEEGHLQAVREIVQKAGGELLLEEQTYAQIRVPLAQVAKVAEAAPALALGVNQRVQTGLMELTPSNQVVTAEGAGGAARANLEPIGIPQFRQEIGVTGAGVKVAIIDSGVDPGHPDLQKTTRGTPKIVDWKDFTAEGRVHLTQNVGRGSTFVAPDGHTYRLPSRPTNSQGGRFGFWDETTVPGLIDRDLNRNGSPIDRFGVLVVDSQTPGVYDLVYVDTDNNWDFTDEQPLRLFRDNQSVARLGRFRSGSAAQRQLAFVVADLDPTGTEVSFGFDSLGHGTQVAGVAAANGSFVGVAPGAQVMALKVINSRNEGDWFAIQRAIQYAVDQGASIINVSLGGLPVASAYDSSASTWLNQIATSRGILIVLAADNTGPGLSSGATLGSPSDVLSVGAYYSPEMWQRDYGVVVPNEGVWWSSGMGPRADGSYLPNLVAPGGSPTTSPHWLNASGYTTAAGTSIAVPHVTGAAALLMEVADRNGLARDHRTIRRSLEQGARRMLGIAQYEQGNGVLDLPRAYKEIQSIHPVPALMGNGAAGGDGLFVRAYRPGNDAFTLTNLTNMLTRVNVYSSERWVKPAFRSVTVPAGQERELPLTFDPPVTPGVHSSFLMLLHPNEVAPSIVLPVTYVQPIQLDPQQRFTAAAELEVTRYQRYFVEVKPGATRLQVSAQVLTGSNGRARGTLQMQVFRPDGKMVFRSDAVGANGAGLTAAFTTHQPVSGVWEVVVTAIPDSDGTNLTAGYHINMQVPNVGLELPLRYTVDPGDRLTLDVPVANPGPPMTVKAEAFGLTRKSDSQPWQVMKRSYQVIDDFTLSTTAGVLLLEIQNVIPATGDLDIWLYRYDLARGWEPYWSSRNRTAGQERMQLRNVPPGRYQVNMLYNGTAPRDLQYQYRRSVLVQNYQLDSQDQARRRESGQKWTVPVTLYAPPSPGRYLGQVALTNTDTGEIVAWYPIEISVGQPTLRVQPMVSQLRVGRPGTVVLEVRDGETNQLVDGAVTVNGQRYITQKGRVTVGVQPTTSVQRLQVEMDLPAYQFYRQEIRVPVSNTWGSHPTGVDTTPEDPVKSLWRQKVESLLP